VLALVATEPVLRQRMMLAFLQFASFTVLWTPIAFLLAGAPYHYDTNVIGLFGLIGIAGALAAPAAGRLSDRGHERHVVTAALVTTLASWALLALGGSSLAALVTGIILLDAGFQGAHINHQRTVFALQPDARSRLNTAYMFAFFLGGVAGSTLAALVYGTFGWTANCLLGAALAAVALTVWATTQRARARQVRCE
jgi:predicted MFS family arabinose efflux permease